MPPKCPILRNKLRRKERVTFFQKLAPAAIAIEACGARPSFGTDAALIRANSGRS
jgi:hypothetical protein